MEATERQQAQQDTAPDGREQRRHPRLATRQAASVRLLGLTLLGEIRDYCRAGLYLALAEPLADPVLSALLPLTPVLVVFTGKVGGRERALQVQAQLARCQATGLGLLVPDMPEAVMQALQAAAQSAALPAAAIEAGRALDPQLRQSLQQECTQHLSAFLNKVLDDFFNDLPEQFAQEAERIAGHLEQNRFHFAAADLPRRRAELAELFFRAVREALQAFVRGDRTAPTDVATDQLALVDEEALDDWLNLSAVINQVEANLGLAMAQFHRRYSLLMGRPVDRANNPFGAEVLCRILQDVLQVQDYTMAMRAVAYKTFGRALAERYPAFYEQLNQTLAGLDALLPPPKREVRVEDTPEPPPQVRPETQADALRRELAEMAEALLAVYLKNQTASFPEATDYSLDRLMAALTRPLADKQALGGETRTPNGLGLPPPAPGTPLRLRAIQGLLRAAVASPGSAEAVSPEATDSGTAPAGLLIDTGALQRAIDALPSLEGIGPGMPASQALDAVLVNSGAAPIPPGWRQHIDNTAVLLSRAAEESASGSEIEALIRRLERPLLKLSLRDPAFLDDPEHPARQVVDLLDQYAMAADDKGRFFDSRLQRFLHLLVDRICSRPEPDLEVFELARDNLAKLLVPIRHTRGLRVARLQEACEGRERIRQARARVEAALAQRFGGQGVPEILLRLLAAGWRHHLVLVEMREGVDSAAWQEGLEVLDRLATWLQPGFVAGVDFPREARALADRIEQRLAQVNLDPAQMQVFSQALADALARVGQGGETPTLPYPVKADARSASALSAAAQEWVMRLQLGDWWLRVKDDVQLPMQLIWINRAEGRCTFANRSATDKLDLTLAEFARLAEEGRMKPWADQNRPLFERSELALLDEGRRLLMQRALQDPLSGLPNRKGFVQQVVQVVRLGQAGDVHILGIVEFDQFRVINNTCGLEAAEALARQLAQQVRTSVGPASLLASFREDTLAFFLPYTGLDAGRQTADRLLEELRDYRFRYGEHSYSIGLSIGLAEYRPALTEVEEALRRADTACGVARSQGRNRVQVYSLSDAQLRSQESLFDWAGRIDSLLEGKGLSLRAQMVMPIGPDPSLLPYYEVLLGIEPEPGVRVPPMSFIPAVERLRRSHEVDLWVLREVFAWITANRASFDAIGGLSINLSTLSLSSPEVLTFLSERLDRMDLPAHKLIFEITETAAIQTYGAAQEFIRQIRRYGCKFSLDDFGSGYTSYAHLKNLRTDTLKIDGAFVRDMVNSHSDYAMVKSMHEVARSLGMQTVAEYVESPLILAKLREIGVDYAQGYAIHKPCPIGEITGVS